MFAPAVGAEIPGEPFYKKNLAPLQAVKGKIK